MQSRNGEQRGFLFTQHSPERAPGPSNENNWSKCHLIKCTKDPEGRQHILNSPLPHLQLSFRRRKQQRHIQSHGHVFGGFQECLKELQQKNIQLLQLGLNCTLSWSLLQDEDIFSHAQQQRLAELLEQSTESKGPFFPTAHSDTTLKHSSTKGWEINTKFFLDITGTPGTKLVEAGPQSSCKSSEGQNRHKVLSLHEQCMAFKKTDLFSCALNTTKYCLALCKAYKVKAKQG